MKARLTCSDFSLIISLRECQHFTKEPLYCKLCNDGGAAANQTTDTLNLMLCTTEDGKKRAFIHASDAAKDFRKLLLKPVYKNVIVTAISVFYRIDDMRKLWIKYRVGKFLRYIPFSSLLVQ